MSEPQDDLLETAPRDGRKILLAVGNQDDGVVLASWVGWLEGVGYPCFMDSNSDSYFDATHWMPLPPPPAEVKG